MSYQAPQSSALDSDQEGLLMQIANLLQMLVSHSATPDSLTRRQRVVVEAATATNMSVNAAQVNSVAWLTGTGFAGTGAPRVTPSADTQSGMPIYHTQANLSVIYNAIAVS
jgi:hypothetical protein